ncbi:4-alpha-glucanotransferase [Clostridium cellulovorans]|uniref:4-alpha-glucanotransferase n=2 Tax=Clostridium cellulovorans TaxID=1493 RepID=D9SR03_CLOC7|nr:4-alpha-glucanotransferase [Clostridium cellulovorans]ADL50291.1 4-alpha-glucanotransferase [Clostridium cellulovorans 743B]BAV13133.1 4-alpha-glucanotransferase [Clostridium cellulovorans]
MRKSGVLLPVASLPSKYGIGAFSKNAYKFIDQLKAAGQSYWQILPLGPTGYGDSPYQSFSTFAGNPYFIDLEELIAEGYLTEEECESYDFGDNERYIDYEKIYLSRFKILKIAFGRSNIKETEEFQKFIANNAYWLEDYALYMAVKNYFDGVSWIKWDDDIRLRKKSALEKYKSKLEDEIAFYQFQQFLFNKQWEALKEYANEADIKIIGDIPIYVAFDSADSWAHPELFQFDENGEPIAVAGCPPDGFSATGQLWGNPLYNWDYHEKTEYKWWVERIAYSFKLYDVVRVDHFRGFDEYYSIPYGSETAEIGSWEKGPGYEIFKEVRKQLGEVNIIAEDLGFLTESVLKLVEETGYPGMKVLEFAFDSREESDYLPHNYVKNCIVYTGTHDNETIVGWYKNLNPDDKKLAIDYLDIKDKTDEDIHWKFIKLALSSVANLAIIPLQDYLGLGNEARINTPSTVGGNWKWRLLEDEITEELVEKINKVTKLYGR